MENKYDVKLRFSINSRNKNALPACRVIFLQNNEELDCRYELLVLFELKLPEDNESYYSTHLFWEDGYPMVYFTEEMLIEKENALFRVWAYSTQITPKKIFESEWKKLKEVLPQNAFVSKKTKLENTINLLANMNTGVMPTFETLAELGVSITDDTNRMRDIGGVVKDLAVKLRDLL